MLFSEGNLQLVDSNNPSTTTLLSTGRLEIYLQGEWGTICKNFDLFVLNFLDSVSCYQLGFSFVGSEIDRANNLG